MDSGAPPSQCFESGPPLHVQEKLGLLRHGDRHIARRCLLAMVICWLPLALLCALEGDLLPWQSDHPFAYDLAAHARYLVAVPLLIAAEATCGARLTAIAGAFLLGGLVSGEGVDRFERAIKSTRRLLSSVYAETIVFALAYVIVLAIVNAAQGKDVPGWQLGTESHSILSVAGWWHALVSLPVMLVLLLGWIWRLILWTRFLLIVARLRLSLLPVHPDRAAGLGFIGHSLRAWGMPAAALGTIVAGTIANQVFNHDVSILEYKRTVGVLLGVSLVIFTAPLASFSSRLLHEWHRGVEQYGALASDLGQQFERRWLHRSKGLNESVLKEADFSATTDLYSIVDRAYAMKILPVDLTSILVLAASTLVPFIPVLLISVPLDVVAGAVAKLLF